MTSIDNIPQTKRDCCSNHSSLIETVT